MIKWTVFILLIMAYFLFILPAMISAASNTLVILGFVSLVFVGVFTIQTLYKAFSQ